jgi:sorbitol/mannitol transport system substrate-binding protein
LRQRVTTDVAQGSGQFDLVFIGLYDTPIFAKRGWLRPFENLPADYDLNDVFKSIRDGLSYGGKLYALPFYGESSMLMYRKDLLEAKGLKMPNQPTYEDIAKIAALLNDKAKAIYGITLRGRPGWGENMAFLGTLVNTFGGTWFDEKWHPTIDYTEWKKAIGFYVDLMKSFERAFSIRHSSDARSETSAQSKSSSILDSGFSAGSRLSNIFLRRCLEKNRN